MKVFYKIIISFNPKFIEKKIEEEWGKISNEAKNLVRKMMEFNVDKRISASEALNNPWIQRNKTNNIMPEKTLKNLSKFEV